MVDALIGTHKFDLTLSLRDLNMEMSGNYEARLEVLSPGVSSRSYIWKSFVVRVHGEYKLDVYEVIHCPLYPECAV